MLHKIGLFLRGAIPLALVVIALVLLPTLVAWVLLGGPFGWQHLLAGVLGGLILGALGGLIFGWALGRYRTRR